MFTIACGPALRESDGTRPRPPVTRSGSGNLKQDAMTLSSQPYAIPVARSRLTPMPTPRVRRQSLTGYRRTVRVLRVLLPALALGMIGLVAAWPQIAPNPAEFQIGYADLRVTEADLQMTGARYVATDAENRPYSISARAVRNLVAGGGVMGLEAPEAEITLTDGAWVWATADAGEYRIEAELLDLTGKVQLIHDGGHVLSTSSAAIDLAGGVVSGTEPVIGHGPFGELAGSGFRVTDQGRRLMLTGESSMTIYPGTLRQDR